MSNRTEHSGLLVCDDFFFINKVTGTADAVGVALSVAESQVAAERQAAAGPRFVIVDLGLSGLRLPELVSALPAENRPAILAFDSHVNTDRIQAAGEAGCDDVLPRSRFSAELPELLKRLAS
ncbi:MAG: response regulator [Planctomycetaceae bacterium]